jgi:ribosome biogenesis GTPase / thiamine phosphate phosphatase
VSRIDIEALEDEWEEDEALPPRRSRELSVKAKQRIEVLGSARVVAVDRGRITVVHEGEILEATLAGTMRGTKAAVGDRVRLRPPRHESDVARIVEVLDRETVLTRTPDDDIAEERVVVANADQVIVVLAADHLEGAPASPTVCWSPPRWVASSRCCASTRRTWWGPTIGRRREVERDLSELVQRYEDIGVEVRRTSVVTGEGIDELRELLAGCWTAFSGHSGVGKSSLFNLLVPEADREVGELGRYGGRHTTPSSRAMPITSLDAWVVDTPGCAPSASGGCGPTSCPGTSRSSPSWGASCPTACTRPSPDAAGRRRIHPERLASYRRLLSALREGS